MDADGGDDGSQSTYISQEFHAPWAEHDNQDGDGGQIPQGVQNNLGMGPDLQMNNNGG